jgi:hypothetical protein
VWLVGLELAGAEEDGHAFAPELVDAALERLAVGEGRVDKGQDDDREPQANGLTDDAQGVRDCRVRPSLGSRAQTKAGVASLPGPSQQQDESTGWLPDWLPAGTWARL